MRRALLSLFGVGFVPGMPGTYASFVTAVALLAASRFGGVDPAHAAALAILLGSLATLLLPTKALLASGEGDPSWIVTDEVAGLGAAVAIALLSSAHGPVAPLVACFVLFRVFDVLKPGPIGRLERLPGALGVLADDLGAGVAAGGLVLLAEAAGAFTGPVLGA